MSHSVLISRNLHHRHHTEDRLHVVDPSSYSSSKNRLTTTNNLKVNNLQARIASLHSTLLALVLRWSISQKQSRPATRFLAFFLLLCFGRTLTFPPTLDKNKKKNLFFFYYFFLFVVMFFLVVFLHSTTTLLYNTPFFHFLIIVIFII